ncbi:MAG: NADP-dependent malic enzyme [Candidatus Edwardsbacteria bacterium]|nr:NADP-dependent malic enzyme [Candidatus Edwardsbacteria bacterium]
MADFDLSLDDLDKLFPAGFTQLQIAQGKTVLLKELALGLHKFYGGKMTTLPKAGLYGKNWFNLWYTPGVSGVSTAIRDDQQASFDLSNRGNLVAVVSDSTRVLGDGDCGPAGGLGVMEGKAFLMKYLGGVDAVALCMDSRDQNGKPDAQKIIDFVKMAQPSFGAVNLEDISQPNCYKVLDTLREECGIPVWHDDAQGTGCVTLAGLINALKLAGKNISEVKIVFYGAGAANTTIFRLVMAAGGKPENCVMFDVDGALGLHRLDIKNDPRYYRQWEICQRSKVVNDIKVENALKGADVLVSLSQSGPGVIKPEWIAGMASKSIVFACANPVPEIYPSQALAAGAFIVATGRGDFPNQVNNSLGFPGILKGALLARASKITDNMAIAAAHAIAEFAEDSGLRPERIVSSMEEWELFPKVTAEVAAQAVKDGVARSSMTKKEAYLKARQDISEARAVIHGLMEHGFIKKPPMELLEKALEKAVTKVRAGVVK